jgi:hypothetical protein
MILAALKVPNRIQALIIDCIERINYIFLKKGIGHGCPRIEQVHQTVGWNFFKAILAGKKTFKNKNLATGGVELLEVVLCDRVGTGDPGLWGRMNVGPIPQKFGKIIIAVHQRTNKILLKLPIRHGST